MLAAISSSVRSWRNSSLPEGSPTLVVPPPISTIGRLPLLLQQAQHHDRDQVADMQAVGGAVEADIGRPRGPAASARVEPARVGASGGRSRARRRRRGKASGGGHRQQPGRFADAAALAQSRGRAMSGRLARAIGLMSGTSLDGVDAAWLETDGERGRPARPDADAALRCRAARRPARSAGPANGAVAAAERALTLAHAECRARAHRRARALRLDLIGFHGQTILHRPEQRRTWQIGDGALLAARTGIAWSAISARPMSRRAARAHRSRRSTTPRWPARCRSRSRC